MRTLPPISILVPSLIGLTGCDVPPDAYRDVLPDDRLLVEFPDGAQGLRSVGEPSAHYQITHDLTVETNTGLKEVLTLIELITSFPPTWSAEDEQTALWGPWIDNGTYGQLWVAEEEGGSYAWAIELRPGEEGPWTPVLAGEVDAGSDATASSGRFGMDFTTIEALGSGDGTVGEIAVEYELFEGGASTTVLFGDFAEDGSIPANAGTHFEHERGVGGLMDVIIEGDLTEPPNGSEEVMILRSRWDSEGAGRTDAYLTEGDFGQLTYTETECWSPAHTVVYFENNFELFSDGDVSDCAFTEASFND
ncbi:MAG TPA: hypothetical protein ENK18_01275 [Deltaproteobacteria bacterium]|nr:hypothetical protein [Deltaproteobacteria bacterium]